MPHPPLSSEFLGPSFTFAEARAAGVARRRLAGADVGHPFRGVYTQGVDLTDLVQRCLALRPSMRSDQWFSHRTAARLWGIPLPWSEEEDGEQLDILTIGTHHPVRRSQVRSWETDDSEIRREIRGGVPLVAAEEAWCQLATLSGDARLSEDRLVAAGDFVLSGIYHPKTDTWSPLCTREELEKAVTRRKGRRGARRLRAAFERARETVGSVMETLLRLGLIDHGLPEPERQVPVDTAVGVLHADLGYPAARLLIEYQGDEHRTSRERWLRDLTRAQLFEDAGFRTMFVGANDVLPDCAALATRVRRALAGRAYGV
jgi:very-short-patch-repair endonuclease